MITVGLHTALRVGELLNLTRESIDFSAGIDSRFGRQRLITEKSLSQDVTPLTEEAASILRARLEKSEYAFELTYDRVRRAFRSACKRAGITYGLSTVGGCVFHTIRHDRELLIEHASSTECDSTDCPTRNLDDDLGICAPEQCRRGKGDREPRIDHKTLARGVSLILSCGNPFTDGKRITALTLNLESVDFGCGASCEGRWL